MAAMRRMLTVLRDPVAWVLVVAGVVEMISGGTLARGAILFAGSALIVADRYRTTHRRSATTPPPQFAAESLQETLATGQWLAIATLAVLVTAALEVHTLPLTAIVGVVGVLAVGWAWLTEPQEEPSQRPSWTSLLTWGGLFLALGLWELSALLGQPSLDQTSHDSPTISYLMEPVLATYPGRAATLGIWVIAGRTLVRRS